MSIFRIFRSMRSADLPRMKHAAAMLLMIAVFGIFTLSGMLFPSVLSALPVSVASALTAALIFMYRSPAVLAPPFLASVLLLFIADTSLSATLPIMTLPASAALALSLYTKASKARAVVYTSVTLGITAALAVLILSLFGQDVIPDTELLRESLKTAISGITINTREGKASLFTPESAAGLADYIILSLPAIFITALNFISFVSASLLSLFCRLFFFSDSIPDGRWEYMPETVSAVIYFLSYAVSAALVPFASYDVIGFAAENLLLALLPAMVIAGAKVSFESATKHDRRVLLVILSFLAITLAPSLYLMVISFWGAGYVIWQSVKPYLKKLFPSERDGEDGEDGEN